MTVDDRDARIAALEEEIGRLRRLAFGSDIEFPLAWDLTGLQQTLLRLLIAREVVSRKAYAAARFPGRVAPHVEPNTFRVQVHLLREKIKPLGVQIHSAGALGYFIDAEMRCHLRQQAQERREAEAAAYAATEAAMLARVA